MKFQDGENIMNIVIKKIYLAQIVVDTEKKIVGDGGWAHERLIRSPTL